MALALWEDGLRGKSRLLTASEACAHRVLYLSRARRQFKMFTLVGHILDVLWTLSDIRLTS